MAVRLSTVEKWKSELDVKKEWIVIESGLSGVLVLHCRICRENAQSLRTLRNFSAAFVNGISGNALKKDNVVKHSKSFMHAKAVTLEIKRSMSLTEICKSECSKAVVNTNDEDRCSVTKLFELAYFLAAEELPFEKFPAFIELEKRHGVSLGSRYTKANDCSEFTTLIGETMRDNVLRSLNKSPFFALIIDGSSDSNVVMDLIFVSFIGSDGKLQTNFLALKAFSDRTAQGIITCIGNMFISFGVSNWQQRLVCVCMDGDAVDMGARRGVAETLSRELGMPWLVTVHCFSHRLELALKDAFSKTYLEEISRMLMNLYQVHTESPTHFPDLRIVAEEIEELITKPEKAHGTRWLQHKKNAIKALLNGYPLIVLHFRRIADENSTDSSRSHGYLNQLTSFKFILHLLAFDMMLTPLAALSMNLQCNSVDLQFVLSSLSACRRMIERIGTNGLEESTQLHTLLGDAERHVSDGNNDNDSVEFKGVKLHDVSQANIYAFSESRQEYAAAIQCCLDGRLREFEEQPIFKGVGILNTATWPKEEAALQKFGTDTLLSVFDHFHGVLAGADREAIISEWDAFKSFWISFSSHLPSCDVWVVLSKHKTLCPNLWLLVQVLLLFPVSSAIVEQGFHVMHRIKTDWRRSLKESMLDHLMRIAIEGPEQSAFNVAGTVEKFFSTSGCPDIQPNKRKHDEIID